MGGSTIVFALTVALLMGSCDQARADEILGTVDTAAGSIELYRERGACVAPALSAAWFSPDRKERVPGCWKPGTEGHLNVVFFDADVARIPMSAVRTQQAL